MRFVEWRDSSGTGGWQSLKTLEEYEPDLCHTVGFVLRETDDFVTLIQSYTNRKQGEENSGDNVIVIPRFAIVRMDEVVPEEQR